MNIFKILRHTGLFCLLAAPAFAATINVSTTDDDNTVNGNCTLREAVRASNANTAIDNCTAGSGTDTIVLSAGTYLLDGAAGVNEENAATGDLDVRATTILTGAGSGATIIDGNATDRVFHLPVAGVTFTLSGVTVRNGNPGNNGGDGGAGVMVEANTTLIVDDAVFHDNIATINAAAGGGAIDSQGNFTITDSEFYENSSQNDGAIRCLASCTGSITDTVIRDNTSIGNVGGGLGAAGNLTLLRVQVLDNANTGSLGAGGVSCLQANSGTNTITITDSLIRGNTATANGGGVAVFLIAGAFQGNPNVTITNTTISGNTAGGIGGGLYVSQGTAQLNNVTIANNTASTGNGIGHAGGTLNARNSLVAGNGSADCSGTISSASYNLVQNATGCTLSGGSGNQTNVNPLLSALADNGGGSQTHAIAVTSPALNGGNPSGCAGASGTLTADQRGVSRSQGSACDIGAYEFSCGFGTVDSTAGETCDDGNNVTEQCSRSGGACTVCDASCQSVAGAITDCGDSVVQAGEECDDGNTTTEACGAGEASCVVCAGDCTEITVTGEASSGGGSSSGASAAAGCSLQRRIPK